MAHWVACLPHLGEIAPVTTDYISMGAKISPDQLHRYLLWRDWELPGDREFTPRMIFIGLNPSTADHREDDPTIRREVAFARREGCGAMWKLNLFAFRATEPKDCAAAADPIGAENDRYLTKTLEQAARHGFPVVAAWGAADFAAARQGWVRRMARDSGVNLLCFGATASGAPKHPLYLSADTPLQPWPIPQTIAA